MSTRAGSNTRSISGLDAEVDWRTLGACRDEDPEIFFPAPGKSSRPAKRVCRRCPVTERCLAWALEQREDFGVWGAQNTSERREAISDAYQQPRKAPAAPPPAREHRPDRPAPHADASGTPRIPRRAGTASRIPAITGAS